MKSGTAMAISFCVAGCVLITVVFMQFKRFAHVLLPLYGPV